MLKQNSFFRLFIFVWISFALIHLTAPLVATPFPVADESFILTGSLENGLTYTTLSSPTLKEGGWVKLTCRIPKDKEHAILAKMTQHALFYGTKKFNREQIISQFNALSLDIDPSSFVQVNDEEYSLQFSLAQNDPRDLEEVLGIAKELLFSPLLENEGIEISRAHLLAAIDESQEDYRPLQNLTKEELQNFHLEWFHPENIHLTLVGFKDPDQIHSLVASSFHSPKSHVEALPSPAQLEEEEGALHIPFLEAIEWTADKQSLVVDGKIWMNEPNWINKSVNGKAIGALLTVLGIGGMIVSFPIWGPAALIAGSLSTASGIYFLSCNYFKDPQYIESVRQIDLQKGCAFAYQKGRAGYTLTPYERRAKFLQEMVDHPQTLSKQPLLVLADLYQLNDPVMAEIFTVDEFNVLSKLKRDFIQQRNQYKMIKESIERELATIAAPYTLARDAALLHARDVYNTNYYVHTQFALKTQRDQSIKEIEKAYQQHKISSSEKDEMIIQAHDYYDAALSNPEMKAGLDSAEMTLTQMELEVQANYAYQVELCKNAIQYHQRMEQVKLGERSLIDYFSQELANLLGTFPVYFTVLPDYLDLRKL